MHIAVFLWGFTGVLGKAISTGEYALVCYRILITIIIGAIILTLKKQWYLFNKKDLKLSLLVGAIIAIHWVFFYGSIKYAGPTIALVCLSTSGMFSSIIEPIFTKHKFNLLELFLGIIAFLGMAIIYKFEANLGLGIAFGVIAAFMSVVFTMMNKKLVSNHNPLLLLVNELSGGLIVLLLLAPLYYHYFPQINNVPHGLDWLWLLLLSGACTVGGQTLALQALKYLSPFTVVLSVNLEPVYGIVWAYLFFNDTKNLSHGFYYGILLIAVSVVLHIWMQLASRKKSNAYL